jgi:hypothetical protein
VLSQYLPGWAEEIHERHPPGLSVSQPGTSCICKGLNPRVEENIWSQGEISSCWRGLESFVFLKRYFYFDEIKDDEMAGHIACIGEIRNVLVC